LSLGTLLATAIIGVGMALGLLQPIASGHLFGFDAYAIVKGGIALFILLPVARVVLMLAIFLHERDYTYAAIATLVLVIIAAGVIAG
ncbi:MAG: DUF1634 domain-containing protein, partial [Rhodanobacter sp.]